MERSIKINKDIVRLQALDYAEKNKIVNQKSINAYVDGFYARHNLKFKEQVEILLEYSNQQDRLSDAGHADARGENYNKYRLCDDYWKDIQNKLTNILKLTNDKNFW